MKWAAFFIIVTWIILYYRELCFANDDSALCGISSCNCTELPGEDIFYDVTCSVEEGNIDEILATSPNNTKKLTIFLPTKIQSKALRLPINIDPVKKFTYLEYFRLLPAEEDIYQRFRLRFTPDTFRHLHFLKHIVINVVIVSGSLRNLIEPVHSLQTLDLSNTKFISYNHTADTMKGLSHKKNFTSLILSNFQTSDLEYCVTEIDLSSFLAPLQHCPLKHLDLSRNGLLRLKPGVNKYAPQLETFNVSQNLIVGNSNGPFMFETLIHKTLKVLDFSNQGLITTVAVEGIYKDNQLQDQHPKLKELFNGFELDPAEASHSDDIYAAQKSAGYNTDSSPSCIEYLSKTRGFDVAYMICNYKDIFCQALQNIAPLHFTGFPCEELPVLNDIWNANCVHFVELPLSPLVFSIDMNVLELGLGGNIIDPSFLNSGNQSMFCIGPNKLRKLSFAFNKYWVETLQIANVVNTKSFKGTENIEEIDARHNDMAIDIMHFIKYTPKLKFFFFRENRAILGNEYDLCNTNTLLQVVDLSMNHISHVPEGALETCQNLQHIYYDHNNLTDFAVKLTAAAQSVSFIDLRYNNISTLSKTSRGYFDEIFDLQNNLEIDLSGNPLSCGCGEGIIEFVAWLQKHRENFTGFEKYTCSGKDGNVFISEVDIGDLSANCNQSNLKDILLGVLIALSIVSAIFTGWQLYRKRWRLKYYLFTLNKFFKRKFGASGRHGAQNAESQCYKYDLYVSYCADDRFWVHNVLMQCLEYNFGFKLCIHYRDFLAGDSIANNIVNCMSTSREILMVVSKNSLERPYCEYELDIAENEIITRRKRLIVVKLGELPTLITNKKLSAILELHTYIPWPEQSEGNKLFFLKIVDILYEKDSHRKINPAALNAFANTTDVKNKISESNL